MHLFHFTPDRLSGAAALGQASVALAVITPWDRRNAAVPASASTGAYANGPKGGGPSTSFPILRRETHASRRLVPSPRPLFQPREGPVGHEEERQHVHGVDAEVELQVYKESDE